MNTRTIDIDKLLVQKLSQNDGAALETLFNKYHTQLLIVSKRIVRDEDHAHDAVQKVFIRLWEKRHDLSIDDSVIGYLMGSVRNQCLELLRRSKTRCFYEEQYSQQIIDNALQKASFNEEKFDDELKKAMEELPERSRQVFDLCKREGLSQQEAADYLNIAVKSVSNHMGIAVKKLRGYFNKKNTNHELFY